MKPLAKMTDGEKIRAYRRMYRWMSKFATGAGSIHVAKAMYFKAKKIPPEDAPWHLCYLCEILKTFTIRHTKRTDRRKKCCSVDWGVRSMRGVHCEKPGSLYHDLIRWDKIRWDNLNPVQRGEKMLAISQLPLSKSRQKP